MKHSEIWAALDTLAAENGLSASGLARRAGLDPTTFNPSKRHTPDGRARWPSTESLAKVLEATGANLETFAHLVAGGRAVSSSSPCARRRIPLIGMTQASLSGFFDEAGLPVCGGWEDVSAPEVGDATAYALEISGGSMEPVFRDGDMIVVSPAAAIRRGDRVVVRTHQEEAMVKQLIRQSAKRIELRSLGVEQADSMFDLSQVFWIHRIIWASQ